MKQKRLISIFLAISLVIGITLCTVVMTSAAQKGSDKLSDTGESAFSSIRTTYVVTLYWDDNDNAYGTRPEEVEVVLTANNGEFGSEYLYLNEENGWENVKNQLPVFYYKGPRSGKICYEYEILELPENYDVTIVQEGNWFKVTCSLKGTPILGDVDNDNEVSIVDAVIIQRYDIGMPVKAFNSDFADVNNDQSIDIIDSTVIQRYLAGFDCSRYDISKNI